MDINDIKRPGGYGQAFEVPEELRPAAKPDSKFSETAGRILDSAPTKSLQVITQFDKSALSDPQKVDTMIRACASELIDSGQNVTGPMSTADKQALSDFLSADPCFRQQVETYLQKVLT
jgi:hypothetical protein